MEFERGVADQPWTRGEIDLVVREYFALYELAQIGATRNKSQVYRDLASLLGVRTASSVALKMSNISAVMIGLGWPELAGIGPMPNIQGALVPAVEAALKQRTRSLDGLARDFVTEPARIGPVDLTFEEAKDFELALKSRPDALEWSAVRRNYLEIEARNHSLGLAGELAVVRSEKSRLHRVGRHDLARNIVHVSQEEGDGLGYDIRSFDHDGKPRLIEVKTTRGGRRSPFFVTEREVAASVKRSSEYVLARVFEFPKAGADAVPKAKIFEVAGAMPDRFKLEADQYRAVGLLG